MSASLSAEECSRSRRTPPAGAWIVEPKVLLVDDRRENLLALQELLSEHGAQLLSARSGVEALELLLVHDVALALVDVNMPEMDGYALAELMRGSERTREVPIIFITAAGPDPLRVAKGYEVGAVDFLTKPIEPRVLEVKVRTFLRLHRQARELAQKAQELQRDITARVEAERAARASEQHFRALADSMPQLVWTAGCDGGVTYYNARVAEYAGAQQGADGRWVWQPLLHPDDLARTAAAWDDAVARQVTYVCEHRVRMADGSFRWHLSRARPVRNETTGVLTWFGTATDIHDRRVVEEQLRRTSAMIGAINAGTPVLIVMKDRDLKFVFANPATLDVLGRPEHEVIGHNEVDWFGPELGEAVLANDRRVLAGRSSATFEEHTPDGRTFLASKTAWLGEDGAVLGLIVVAQDITERKRLEEERRDHSHRLAAALEVAEKAVQAREQLVSLVSHDLRNPLGAIVMQTALLRRQLEEDGLVAPDVLAVGLGRLERQSGKMDRLLGELLDLARLHAGRSLTLERSACDLVRLARSVADEHRRGAPRHEIVVRAELGTLVGSWDVDRIERVVGNLVSNAVKYSPRGGTVTLHVAREDAAGPLALLTVEDQGVGIRPEDQARIFEWFVRGANAERFIHGTGVGLAGARQIVEQHGGVITVESEEGRGSRFTVRLPLDGGAGDA